ncbi:MAG TPA: hypothetical protein VHN14_26110, partial [Kofleriaceae bacterium]|nr:hypothetical protein [Kofleriaceae bacterium]
MKRYLMSVSIGSLSLIAIAGCVATDETSGGNGAEGTDTSVTQQGVTAAGDPLPGTDLEAFAAARDNFAAEEDINDRL